MVCVFHLHLWMRNPHVVGEEVTLLHLSANIVFHFGKEVSLLLFSPHHQRPSEINEFRVRREIPRGMGIAPCSFTGGCRVDNGPPRNICYNREVREVNNKVTTAYCLPETKGVN